MIDRPKNRAEWERVRQICCETAKSGDPIDRARWPFFGEHWVGPYQLLEPDWAYVFREKEGGEILGYLTGAPNTIRYERKKLRRFVPKLVAKVLSRRYAWNSDTKRFLKRAFRIEKSPEQSFPDDIQKVLERDYPAHLHINFDARARGKGAGRALMEAYIADLRSKGVPGLHVHCGAKPYDFYVKMGFSEIARLEFAPNVWVFVLGRKFS